MLVVPASGRRWRQTAMFDDHFQAGLDVVVMDWRGFTHFSLLNNSFSLRNNLPAPELSLNFTRRQKHTEKTRFYLKRQWTEGKGWGCHGAFHWPQIKDLREWKQLTESVNMGDQSRRAHTLCRAAQKHVSTHRRRRSFLSSTSASRFNSISALSASPSPRKMWVNKRG